MAKAPGTILAQAGLGGRIPNARVRPKDIRPGAQQVCCVTRNGWAQRDTDDLGGLDLPCQHAVGGSAADRTNLHTCFVDRVDIRKFLSRCGDVDKADDPKVRRRIRLVRGRTPPSTVMAIMPTRSFPPGAISDAGA
jgi:hypothetical protein